MTNGWEALLAKALTYCLINLLLRLLLGRPLMSAALAFWAGWIFLMVAGVVVAQNGWIQLGQNSIPAINLLFQGAFIGFIVGSVLAPK